MTPRERAKQIVDGPWYPEPYNTRAQISREQLISRIETQIIDAIKEERENAMPWQPIETAPKDGRRIIIGDFTIGRSHQLIAWWNEIDSRWAADYVKLGNFLNWSHWMPLADPPRVTEDELRAWDESPTPR